MAFATTMFQPQIQPQANGDMIHLIACADGSVRKVTTHSDREQTTTGDNRPTLETVSYDRISTTEEMDVPFFGS